MRIINIGQAVKWDYLEESYLDEEYDLNNLTHNVDTFVYAYGQASYEGGGSAIWRDDKGGWHHEYLSHCSCNGPLDNFNGKGDGETLDELEKSFTKEYNDEEIGPIFKEIRRRGFK